MREKSRQKTMNFTQRIQEMVDEIRSKIGYANDTAVVHASIIHYYDATIDSYKSIKKQAIPRPNIPVAEQRKIDGENRQIQMCTDLGGRVVQNPGGKICIYKDYRYATEYEQELPIEMLDLEMLKNQYTPSFEEVNKAREKEGLPTL